MKTNLGKGSSTIFHPFNMQLKPLLRYITIITGSLQPSLPVNFHELRGILKRGKTVEMFMLQEFSCHKRKVHLASWHRVFSNWAEIELKLGQNWTEI